MDKCFLFTQHLDDNGCFCLKMTSSGELLSPPAQRSFSEIETLQSDCSTLIVETATHASLLDLELPWLPERKARIAIPFALEEKVAQPVEELHFAFDKLRFQNNHYLITIISKERIQFIINTLNEHNIDYEAITLDWFALSSHELVVTESVLLVNNEDFKGALSGDLALTYLKNHPQDPALFFADSKIIAETSMPKNSESSCAWIAKKLFESKPLNLCQGDMLHGNTSDWVSKGYKLAALMGCLWLLSLLFVNALSLHSLKKQNKVLDDQIATIYREFFPEAKQVISPKFRISQLLSNNTSDKQSRFWFLLNQFAEGVNESEHTIEDIRYQNKTLIVTLVSADFSSLEEIENKLKSLQLKVRQTQATTREQHVVATLELT
ncbi:type II secretion system protein GspL [uncultured Legionella sp.]|uniref:type II secretion system protein GspL n=1 Tax=uncultured Legionella sp. TaxID=210934 RepID=UPI0026057986|nr:type II secretion system protein GspL [uncultured Legionella sp.]